MCGCLRQPSGSYHAILRVVRPEVEMHCDTMSDFSMGLTGDINDIMNAHNLAMVALTSRLQHERNYNDENC